ncbi:MoaD/ThiS family protein [Desulforhopalus singaporensis]|uniref:Uncharacterized protein n=1 Tax=Desulforhopalus singaporensis TaxID=91360 RepID=A0A1H0LWN7_9BACT|nr:MoaD/ThiS family protein [Desulforhopalus singaporensis]SDO72396.1 hypothetical protein SAMN05660330_00879 [Desulforhopalus singaporensis]
MKVHLRLLGTLPDYYPGDYPETGLDLDVPAGITVGELADLVQMPRERISIVSVNGFLAKADDKVPENGVVKFLQSLHGG